MRVWDVKERKMVQLVNLNKDEAGNDREVDPKTWELGHGSRGWSVDVIAEGKLIAVGFRNGDVRIYQASNMQILKNIELRKEVISEVKFSPNKNYLAVGSHDNKIDVYTVHDMQKKCTLDSSTSFITALDWSENSDSIRTNDASYEILYYNVESKK